MKQIKDVLGLVERYAGSSGAAVIQKAHALATACLTAETPNADTTDQAIAAAQILAELKIQVETVAAALLVDLPDQVCPPNSIQSQVGEPVAHLVNSVRKMRKLPYLSSPNKLGWSDKQRSELYHAFVAALETPQSILVELAHQLYKLRNLSAFFSPEQRQIVFDTLEVYAPLAHRMGVWRIKWELEDEAFRFTHPEQFYKIAEALDERRENREVALRHLAAKLTGELAQRGIRVKIQARPKHIYSIYRKMQRKGVPLEAVYDIRALRVLVKDKATCYRVLGIIHQLWEPIPDQLDDYIANPKRNGYQALHTAVMDKKGQTLEVQIRNHKMHQEAEFGVAAHWRYKEFHGSQQEPWKKKDQDAEHAMEGKISWLRSLLVDRRQPPTEAPPAQEPPASSSSEPIFVSTPQGDVIRLPAGSTPIDFAYHIHTELGHSCSLAKVDGRIVPLNYQLGSGETVEIVAGKRSGPNINWLSRERGFIQTRGAHRKISAWFRRQKRQENMARGHEILERELTKRGLKSSRSFDQIARQLNYQNSDDLLVQVGSGAVSVDKLRPAIIGETKPSREELAREAEQELVTEKDETKTLIEKKLSAQQAADGRTTRGLLVASMDGLHTNLARCCYPVPPEEIRGYVTRGHGVTIHCADCPNVLSLRQQNRVVPAAWGETRDPLYLAMISVEAINRRGLMGDIGQAVAQEHIDIREAKVKKKAHWAIFELLLEVSDADQLARAMLKLERANGVRRVHRHKG